MPRATPFTPVDGNGRIIGAASDANGNPQGSAANPTSVKPGALSSSTTDRSGTATTTSGGLSVPANTSRAALVGQNIGTVNIGFNEFNGTAAIGTAGTYTVPPNGSFSISTTNKVNFIAASGSVAVTMTETNG